MSAKQSISTPGWSATQKIVHFVGIGGIGISALARYYLSQKWRVSGSDITASRITKKLQKDGVKVKIWHKKSNLPKDARLVIYSLAIKPSNPELMAAKRQNIQTISYPEAVGALTKKYKTIAVAGAHGKSTTIALVGLILKKAGLDPSIIIGTELKELGGKNFRRGRGSYLVLEADEFGKAFLYYSPALMVVTNIDREHLDIYKNLTRVKNVFLKFLAQTKNGGTLILNKDNEAITSLVPRIKKIAKNRGLTITWYSIHGNTAKNIRRVIKIPGPHNISNAVAAYKVGRTLGISHKKILSVISEYRGAWRRMEYRGRFNGMLVYDDYAHHPTEIKATLQAFREKFPKAIIVCIFQPHQAERLRLLFKEFSNAFGEADILIFLPTYHVVGREYVSSKFTSEKLAAAIKKKHSQKVVYYLNNPKKLRSFLKTILHKSAYSPRRPALVIMMGAGDIVNYTSALLR